MLLIIVYQYLYRGFLQHRFILHLQISRTFLEKIILEKKIRGASDLAPKTQLAAGFLHNILAPEDHPAQTDSSNPSHTPSSATNLEIHVHQVNLVLDNVHVISCITFRFCICPLVPVFWLCSIRSLLGNSLLLWTTILLCWSHSRGTSQKWAK